MQNRKRDYSDHLQDLLYKRFLPFRFHPLLLLRGPPLSQRRQQVGRHRRWKTSNWPSRTRCHLSLPLSLRNCPAWPRAELLFPFSRPRNDDDCVIRTGNRYRRKGGRSARNPVGPMNIWFLAARESWRIDSFHHRAADAFCGARAESLFPWLRDGCSAVLLCFSCLFFCQWLVSPAFWPLADGE